MFDSGGNSVKIEVWSNDYSGILGFRVHSFAMDCLILDKVFDLHAAFPHQ